MKKLFMMAAVAALAFGVSSCDKGPGEGPGGVDPIVGDGTATGMKFSLVLPAGNGGGATRPTDFLIPGHTTESQVSDVHVFVFTDGGVNDGKAVTTGSYTALSPFADWFEIATGPGAPSDGSVLYEMKAGKQVSTVAGPVRIWVAVNLPTGFVPDNSTPTDPTDDGFATEAAMLAATSTITTMSTANKFAMYSAGEKEELVVLNTDGTVPTDNQLDISVTRVVSKAVASFSATKFPLSPGKAVSWTVTEAKDTAFATAVTEPTLHYRIAHWFLFQDVAASYVAPNYALPWNSTLPRPKTYTGTLSGGNPTYDNIYSYQQSILHDSNKADEKKFMTAVPASDTDWQNIGAPQRQYIGENASGTSAQSHLATTAWIATGVRANAYLVWDETIATGGVPSLSGTDAGVMKLKWMYEAAGWGAALDLTTDTNASNIHVLSFNNKKYFTKDTEVAKIRLGIAYNGAYNEGNRIIDHLFVAGTGYSFTAGGVTYTYPDKAAWKATGIDNPEIPLTDILLEDFLALHPEYNPGEIIYWKGYAHFPYYINLDGSVTNLLRNQLIHLDVEDLSTTATASYSFAGYPGQNPTKEYPLNVEHPLYHAVNNPDPYGTDQMTGSARIPIDISSPDNNPNVVPPGPIVPDQTAITINVTLNPWGYVKNGMILGEQ